MRKNYNILYYIAIFGVFAINLIDVSKVINIGGTLRNMLCIILSLLFITKIVMSKFYKKQIIPIVIFGMISLYTSYVLSDYVFLINFLAIIAIKDIDVKKVVKIDLVIKLFFLSINTILYFWDYKFNYAKIINTFVFTLKYGARFSFYFSHPNTASGIAIWAAIDIIYLYGDKLKYIIFSILLVCFYFYFTKSRTSIYIFGIFLIILFLCNTNKINLVLLKKITKWMPEICFLLTLLLTVIPNVIGNENFVNRLDIILSRRISYSNFAYKMYGWHLLANNTNLADKGLIIDNFYMRSLISYGVSISFVLMYTYKKINREINNVELSILFVLPIYLFNELFCYNVGRSIALLVIGDIILNRIKNNNDSTDKIEENK